MAARVLFYVQHLLGIGHVVRAGRVAAGLAAAGFEVTLVSGGTPHPALAPAGISLVQLTPVKAGPEGFAALVHADGRAFGDADAEARRDRLLSTFEAVQPDILITEAFPFGRRQMRFELIPLLERARSAVKPPLIAASIRDILQENRKAGRDAETADLVTQFYDLVLVHGDESLAPLAATFPLAERFADKVVYTGLVGPGGAAADSNEPPPYDVIVSAGGGAVGAELLQAALLARPLSALRDANWLVVTGPNMAEDEADRLASLSGKGVTIVRFVPDLPARLRQARLAISQAGYNSVGDVLAAGCAAVLVPFAAGGETEQTRRAEAMAARGWAACVTEAELSPERLTAAIEAALILPPRPPIALDGAARTAGILRAALSARRSA
jgi:predicted glycosyltransferase